MRTGSPFDLELSWEKVLHNELQKPYIKDLAAFVECERASGVEIYPPEAEVFRAFWETPYEQVNVLIVGQDPYHGPGQAHGLSFSVGEGVKSPPSLKNIYKELASDVGFQIPDHGNLLPWAKQGVMLLNATLTVQKGQPMSHNGKGWERFTDAVVAGLVEREDPVVFVLWGKSAEQKCEAVLSSHEKRNHLIIKSPHPSPFSARRGFLGSKPFSKINKFLVEQGKEPIDWRL